MSSLAILAFWTLVGGLVVAADLPLDLVMLLPNGRDLGGHRTAAGTVVRSGLVFRAAAPGTDDHAEELGALGITRAMDLRTLDEREMRPDVLPHGAQVVVVDMLADEPEAGPASLGAIARAALKGDTEALTPDRLDEIFVQGYRSFVTLPSARSATATVIQHLADDQAGPTLLHCTAGKDRTGWVVAVLLTSIGVSWDDVMADYLRSGPEVLALFAPFRERVAEQGGDVAAMERAISVFPHYLDSARDQVLSEFGDWDTFQVEGLGIPPATWDTLAERLTTSA